MKVVLAIDESGRKDRLFVIILLKSIKLCRVFNKLLLERVRVGLQLLREVIQFPNLKCVFVYFITQSFELLVIDLVDVRLVSEVPLDLLVYSSALCVEVLLDLGHVSVLDVHFVVQFFDLLLQVYDIVIHKRVFGTRTEDVVQLLHGVQAVLVDVEFVDGGLVAFLVRVLFGDRGCDVLEGNGVVTGVLFD